jgi:hypothetical protein
LLHRPHFLLDQGYFFFCDLPRSHPLVQFKRGVQLWTDGLLAGADKVVQEKSEERFESGLNSALHRV